MEATLILPVVARWVHIGCAMAAIGGPFFVRFALLPAAGKVLDPAKQQELREAVNARWRKIVYALITLFLITGTYNFLVETRVHGVLVTARWKDFSADDKHLYHMLFGIKMLAAFSIFILASALAGRTKTFEPIRRSAKLWIGVLLLCGAVIVVCSGVMRQIPAPHPSTPQEVGQEIKSVLSK